MVSYTLIFATHVTNQLQAPKNLPAVAKQAKILDYFRESMSVFTLKELEKNLQSVASINGMQVKEYLQALQDENLIRVEKIGSGNWYWCFMSDAKKTKENMINNLEAEESKLMASVADTEKQIEEEMAKREDDNEMLEGNGMDRKALLEAHDALLKEMELLDKELACYSDSDPAEILSKMEETKRLKASAIRWTDNIESLESLLLALTNDRNRTAEIMQSACGDEYVLGEGLKDL
jgi:chromosome segregation ATPase